MYLPLYWKGCVCEGVGDRTELPLHWPSAFLSRSPELLNRISSPTRLIPNSQSGAWGLPLLDADFLYRNFSPTGLVSKLTDFLSSLSYIIVPPPPSSCGRHNLALIQPVPGQGYNILIILRPDAPVIYTGVFPILTAWPGRRSIYNKSTLFSKSFKLLFIFLSP